MEEETQVTQFAIQIFFPTKVHRNLYQMGFRDFWYRFGITHRIHVWHIFAYIYHEHQPNVGRYAMHGSYGLGSSFYPFITCFLCSKECPGRVDSVAFGCDINVPRPKQHLFSFKQRGNARTDASQPTSPLT